jgi:hypothetical protein
MHVGLPRSQTLLSEKERKHLCNLFEKASLDPTDTPSPEVIRKMLKKYGQNFLEKRTLKLFDSIQEDDIILLDALVEVVLDELEEWDGEVEELVAEGEQPRIQIQTGLRLCLKLDSLAGQTKVYVRFKTSKMFPEDGLNLRESDGTDKTRIWLCREAYQGWSTPLIAVGNGTVEKLDGASLDWNHGVQFFDSENRWRAKLRGADVRLFRLGTIDGLPDWVETQKLERGREFLIAFSQRVEESIIKWAEESCGYFKQEQVSGLPSGWSLIRIKNATVSCPEIDVLSVSTSVRLILIEGVKSGKGNVYFKFAPPKVVIENSSGLEKVTMNGVQLRQPDVSSPIWVLPDDAPVEQSLRIEVVIEEHRLSKIIHLKEFDLPGSFDETPCRDNSGKICRNDIPVRVCGSIVSGEREQISYPSIIPTHLGDKIIFIGEKPGEIADWPHDATPSSWHPVWAIVCKGRKQREAFFCGTPEHIKGNYCLAGPIGDRLCIKGWKEALWVRRKITVPPEIKHIRKIWDKYMEAAKNV